MSADIEINGLTVLTGRCPREQKALCDELYNAGKSMRMSTLRPGMFSNAKPTPDALIPAMEKVKTALREMGTGKLDVFDGMSESERVFDKMRYVLGNWAMYSKVHDTLILESPEAYLHPYYQNILAEAVVLAVKGGVKMFVETNSPNFMLAIDAYMRKHNIRECVRFYQMRRGEEYAVKCEDVTNRLEAVYYDFVGPLAEMDVLRNLCDDEYYDEEGGE